MSYNFSPACNDNYNIMKRSFILCLRLVKFISSSTIALKLLAFGIHSHIIYEMRINLLWGQNLKYLLSSLVKLSKIDKSEKTNMFPKGAIARFHLVHFMHNELYSA